MSLPVRVEATRNPEGGPGALALTFPHQSLQANIPGACAEVLALLAGRFATTSPAEAERLAVSVSITITRSMS